MTDKHLSDEEIQSFSMAELVDPTNALEHIKHCADCATRVNEYRTLMSAIEGEPPAAFEFDVAALVLEKIPLPVSKREIEFPIGWLIFLSVAIFASLVIYFSKSYLGIILVGVGSIVTYVTAALMVAIGSILVADMLRSYHRKLQRLDMQ